MTHDFVAPSTQEFKNWLLDRTFAALVREASLVPILASVEEVVIPEKIPTAVCPWCLRRWAKDEACVFITCGHIGNEWFYKDQGCGRPWCFLCGKKLCGQNFNPMTGERLPTARSMHDAECCKNEVGFEQTNYCGGGHNPHCVKRW